MIVEGDRTHAEVWPRQKNKTKRSLKYSKEGNNKNKSVVLS